FVFVGQDPDDAVVAATCAAELAFGAESAGWTPDRIDARVRELLDRLGLTGKADRAPSALSGGQRQRLVIGAAVVAGARVLLLDEPLSQLDPEGAHAVMAFLRALADDGVAVLCVEHRLEIAMPVATRTVLMDRGRVVADPLRDPADLRTRGLHGPALDELRERTGAARWRATRAAPPEDPRPVGIGVTHVSDVSFAWPGDTRCIEEVSLDVSTGERVALVGANGAGKSTLLGLVSGRLKPSRGRVRREGRVVEVPQNPDLALFCETVAEELAYGPEEARRPRAEIDRIVATAAAALSVDDLLARPPQALSRGQRLRAAVAAALTCAPRLLVLDEPTSGQDRDQVDRMLAALPAALPDGAVLFACHDLDVVLRHATRVVVLDRGRVVGDGRPLPTLLAAEARGLPLPLPPLARLCADLGLPYAAPERLLAWLEAA
ncbi:MAG: ATP-binding cassette domain-containing protein, partial [Myxococcota bacterium]